jgi:hypothetical protein
MHTGLAMKAKAFCVFYVMHQGVLERLVTCVVSHGIAVQLLIHACYNN